MKPHPNINLSANIKYFVTLCLIALFVGACVKMKEIIPPKAEITNIYNITDSTVNVDVQVTRQSNAWQEHFYLNVDSISNAGDKFQVQTISLNPSNNAPLFHLNNSYSTKISKLKIKTKYSLGLYFSGEFDLGGPNEWHNFSIGELKSFTTN